MLYDITAINIGERKRPADPVKVAKLAESIGTLGLLQPVLVSPEFDLLAGLHRLEACRALGDTDIEIKVFDIDAAVDALASEHPDLSRGELRELVIELAEIDENLIRDNLTALQESIQLYRRKQIYELLHPETRNGGDRGNQHTGGKPREADGQIVHLPSFAEDAAEKVGMAARSIRRKTKIGEVLEPYAADIADTPIENKQSDLLALTKFEDEKRQRAIAAIKRGIARSVADFKQQERERAIAEQRAQQVICADFVEAPAALLLSKVDRRSVDLLLTDPPYSTDVDDMPAFLDTWLYAALDTVKDTGRAFICIGPYPEELALYVTRLVKYDRLTFGNVLVWTYRNTIGPTPSHAFKNNWQAILYLYGKDAPPLDSPALTDQFSVIDISAPDGRQGDRYHAWQKPAALAERLIRISTKPGDFVLDPFCCTGTFGLAAADLGRRSLSGDINPDNLVIFAERGGVEVEI
jgi:DNA modification methylase